MKNSNYEITDEIYKIKKKQYIIRVILSLPFILTILGSVYGMIVGVDFCMLGECTKTKGIKALGTIFVFLIFVWWIYIPFIVLIIVSEIKYNKKLQRFIK